MSAESCANPENEVWRPRPAPDLATHIDSLRITGRFGRNHV